MSLAKDFSDEQIAMIQSWADEGDGLSEIQKKLDSEMEVKVTYLELRFLIDDLGVKIPEIQPEVEDEDETVSEDDDTDSEEEVEKVASGDDAVVSISALQRPGALISGTVAFAGGESAEWWLDQMGQLGMNPKNEDFRPSEAQMISFQKELQRTVQEKGGL